MKRLQSNTLFSQSTTLFSESNSLFSTLELYFLLTLDETMNSNSFPTVLGDIESGQKRIMQRVDISREY